MENNLIKQTNTSKRWMVVYTRSRFEKKVDKNLNQQGIYSFCPIVKSKHQWADRIKTVDTPLFSSYIFVKISLSEVERVKQTSGVISFVVNNNKPVTLNDNEILRIEEIVKSYQNIEIVDVNKLNIGDEVRINNGLLYNTQGVVKTISGKSVVMAIDQLNCVLMVKVKTEHVVPASRVLNTILVASILLYTFLIASATVSL
ncbi:UpxY family transcription antiterminator [Mucilaginibacter sp. UR6-1]|uniref:UpxY family transcription antiterminator n=1 Tax=Mucilaginibacter sp. UR6-1 TaxID=1435643 RepID=UPI001E4E8673|nr:UpxY family transcription antiterminator [Mucilaginibacter sp. UR6-1]MCC8408172.1 UpxY family transcription antiterminator [Mucilaginibacter sp. UR6-1]